MYKRQAQAEGRSQNGGDHGDEDVARRLGHALLGGAGLTGLSRLGRTLTVRRTGTGSAETEQTALLGLLAILAILTGLAGKRVAVVLLRLRGRIERIAVALRLRVIGCLLYTSGLNRVVGELAGAVHLAVGTGFGALHADGLDLAVLAENLGGGGVEVHVVLSVGRVAFEVDVAVVFHVFGHLADGEQLLDLSLIHI